MTIIPINGIIFLLTCCTGSLVVATGSSAVADSNPEWDRATTARVLQRQLNEQVDISAMYGASWADTSNVEWDDYQQAWRMLGFMVDCEDDSHWDDDGYSGSGDYSYSSDACRRYVLWAAYVDPYYEGGGIGEYQFLDRSTGNWDSTACNVAAAGGNGNNNRCAKMDCHESDTHWKLLGLFKHRQPDDWMEQLFKHEGVCVWSDEEYAFMKNARKAWPKGCTATGSSTMSGRTIYSAIKPVSGGSIQLGLYTDEKCTDEYNGVNSDASKIMGGNFLTNVQNSHDSGDSTNYDFSDWSTSQALEYWEKSLGAFKICQPCVAYDINNYFDGNNQGSSYGTYDCGNENNYDDGGGGGGDCVEDNFDCYDDAGYTNVNQCMKFRAKTHMDPATIRDIMLAHNQGTLVSSLPLSGMSEPSMGFFRLVGKFLVSFLYLCCALYFFYHSFTYFRKAQKNEHFPKVSLSMSGSTKEPFVFA